MPFKTQTRNTQPSASMICGGTRKRPPKSDFQDRPFKRPCYASEPPTARSTSSFLTPEKLLNVNHHRSPFREPLGNNHATMTPEEAETNVVEFMRKHLTPVKVAGKKEDLSDRPLFTFEQVSLVCAKMLKEQQERIQEEYDKILKEKLTEQYDTFVKFTHDQIQRDMKTNEHPSYMS